MTRAGREEAVKAIGTSRKWLAIAAVAAFHAFVAAAVAAEETPESPNSRRAEREAMVTRQIARRGVRSERVLAAMRRVPRHEFVPPAQRGRAYDDSPLPIGYGQTISQPYIVALMTELAEVRRGDSVLEVGTGSAYQAAVLAELTDRVFTMEIVPELAGSAAERLDRLGYDGVTSRQGDGYHGWPEEAPFDVIVVTAAADHIPPPLVRQLEAGGRMVIPVGHAFAVQRLMLVTKNDEGDVRSRDVLPVRFVPLTGGGTRGRRE